VSLRIRILTGVAGVCAALLGVAATGRTQAQESVPLAHNVFFTLKDSSEAAKDRLVNGCRKYLQGHPGELFFAAGTLVREHNREVNDRDFDVSLHIVFRSKADHDRYQAADRHKTFIAEQQDNWARVRVFDSYVPRPVVH
jgi:hypothetical protein